jgi:hypothetical protein
MSEQPKRRRGNGGNPNWVKGGPSPNPKGRNAGTREMIGRQLLADMADAWHLYGVHALKAMATDDPSGFVKAYVSLLPKEVKVDATETMTEDQLLGRIQDLSVDLDDKTKLVIARVLNLGETKH